MTLTENAKQKFDGAGKEVKESLELLRKEVEELSPKVKEKLKGAGEEIKETAQELTREIKSLTQKVSNIFSQKKKHHGMKIHIDRGVAPHGSERWNPHFSRFQQRSEPLLDDFFNDFGLSPYEKQDLRGMMTGAAPFEWPYVDVSENEKEIFMTAELPGVDKNDLNIFISKNRITIRGEKREQKKEKGRDYHRIERFYGFFNRSFGLPCQVETENANASFKDGLLHIRLPKTAAACARTKRIKVRVA